MNVWMYVIHSMETAIDDCYKGEVDFNQGDGDAWDQAVAFYSGSLEGTDGKGKGKLVHEIADERCIDFKTCGPPGDRTDGQAYVNHQIRKYFKFGQRHLVAGECDDAKASKEKIEDLMAVPLVQGTLKYAHKLEFDKADKKAHVEGASYAAAVLPLVYHCDARAAQAIHDNMGVGASSTTFAHVKNAFQETYRCMGITCDEVGGYYDDATLDYFEGAAPCDPSTTASSNDKNTVGVAVGLTFGIVAAVLVGAFVFARKRKTMDPTTPRKNPTFVTTTESDIS